MKKLSLSLVLLIFFHSISIGQDVYIYNKNGDKIYLNKTGKSVIRIDDISDTNTVKEIKRLDSNAKILTNQLVISDISTSRIRTFSAKSSVSSIDLLSIGEHFYWVENNSIILKVKQGVSIDTLLSSNNIGYKKREQLGSDESVFIVELQNGYDAISICNSLFESGNVVFAQPNWGMYGKFAQNDKYSYQWNLHTNSAYDINVEAAWNLAEGEGIKVAVLDEGIELTHPDLVANLLPGYDATNGSQVGAEGSHQAGDDHGTRCAGIIAASDNNIGIKGIAYKSKIIPIRIAYSDPNNPDDWIAYSDEIVEAIKYAWKTAGADVLSNSWSYDPGGIDAAVNNEIDSAIVQGRGGKGCVVVFASGNDANDDVNYPGALSNVIAVGSINSSGIRATSSNYGIDLDIVAPGVGITTTDINGGYCYNYGGTSAACPHVAGVAALLLSYRPNLMGYQVKQAIERTARKIGQSENRYTYVDYSQLNIPPQLRGFFPPNGSWNSEVGYGLVDAYAALSYVDLLYPTADLYVRDNGTDNGNEPNLIEGNEYYNSPDIYLTDPNRQFPTFLNGIINPKPGQTYKVNVRVKNKSNIPSVENKKLYLRWTIAGTSPMWKSNWFDNGSICGQAKSGAIATLLIPSIPANGTRIVSTEWTVPSFEGTQTCINVPGATWRLSIAAVLEDGHQTSGIDATALDMNLFTASNNNVAWRNYTVLSTETPVAVTTLKNPFNTNKSFDLKFSPADVATENMLNEYVNVYMILSNELMQAWNDGGNQGEDIEIHEGNRIKLNSLNARLNNVVMSGNSDLLYAIEIEYKDYYDTEIPLELKMTQTCHEIDQVDSFLSRLTYYVYLNEKFDIKVIAKENARALAGDNVQFTAESDELDAVFTWYNMSGDSIGNGNVLNVQADQTQRYYLKGYSSTVDAYGYDSVALVVRNGAITAISPNPTSGHTVVTYNLASSVSAASIVVTNSSGLTVYSSAIDVSATTHTLNVQNLVAGQYSVRLVSATGEVLDTKTLIVQ